MIPTIIIAISIILDGVLSNFLPYTVNALSLFTPMLTVVSIFIIYPFYTKKEKYYYLTAIITGIIYNLFYTNMLFYNAVIFLILAIITKYINKNFEVNYLNIIIQTLVIISSYEIINACIIVVFNLVPMSFYRLFYKISHSLLLNIIYSEILLLILNKLPKKYKKININ